MRKPGPKKTPKEILAAKGARIRSDRYPHSKTVMSVSKGGNHKLLATAVEPPKHLTRGAKREWKVVSQFLHENNLSHAIFNGTLELYCYYLDQHREMQSFIRTVGRTYAITNKSGEEEWRVRPEVKLMDDAAKQVKSIAGEFGLTPSSYSQVRTPQADPEQGELWPDMKAG